VNILVEQDIGIKSKWNRENATSGKNSCGALKQKPLATAIREEEHSLWLKQTIYAFKKAKYVT